MSYYSSGGPLALPSGRRTPPASFSPPDWPYSPLAVAARGWVQWPIFGLLDLLVRTEVSGLERLESLDRPALFVANHASHLDTPVLLRVLPDHRRRRIAVAAAHDYFFSHALVGVLVGLGVGGFPVARAAVVRPVLEHCARLRERGWSMLFFPEGTRSATGAIGPFKHGVGVIALKLGLPVVPIRTRGLFELLPKGRVLPRPGRATIHFGTPLEFEPATPTRTVTGSIAGALHAL
jgi:1-acyl-sn-glycerol-3-phosphate acyltransferase